VLQQLNRTSSSVMFTSLSMVAARQMLQRRW